MIQRIFIPGFCLLFMLSLTRVFGSTEDSGITGNKKEKYSLPIINRQHFEEELRQQTNQPGELQALADLAGYFVEWEANYTIADSLLSEGIEKAQMTYDNSKILTAYYNYLMIIDNYEFSSNAKKIITALEPMLNSSTKEVDSWKCRAALAKGYMLLFQYDRAKDYAYQALTTAIQMKDPIKTAQSHIAVGKIQQSMNNNVEAIRNFLDALTIGENERDMVLRMDCYDELSNFYNLLKANDKAVSYKLKELDIAENELHPDSLRIMTLKFDLEVIAFNNREVNERQLAAILDFAYRNHYTKLQQLCLTAFRNHLIKQNHLAQLYGLYHKQYPEELDRIRENDTTLYYRLQAFFYEYKRQLDSAAVYYQMAAQRLDQSNDKFRKASFYLRYGDFFTRSESYDEAIREYTKAYDLAATLPYYEFMIQSSSKLEQIYLDRKDFGNAYTFSKRRQELEDSVRQIEQKDQLQLLEIENEEVLREQRIEQAKDDERRRNNIQYTAITALIATGFLFLIILGGYDVSPALIRMVGFFCFILFFEFLVMLLDKWIHRITHGEPWEVLGIKIVLMSGLLPLHHLIEKRVIHHLTHKKLNLSLLRFFRRKKSTAPDLQTVEKDA